MRVIKLIIQYILTICLALALLAFILINIFSSSILSENYILSKLEEEDYYSKTYEDAESNFKKYIEQSGLDETVLDNIITEEKVEKDTKKILSNIFNGLQEEVDVEEISSKLKENINMSLGRETTSAEKKSIDSFVDIICNEYKTTVSNTKYEKQINSAYKKVMTYMDLTKKALLVVIVASTILILMLTIRRAHRFLARIGVAFTVDGLLFILANKYINTKVRIEGIQILNNPISVVLRSMLQDILNTVVKYGTILLSSGIVLILIYAVIKGIRKAKRVKEQYNPEK